VRGGTGEIEMVGAELSDRSTVDVVYIVRQPIIPFNKYATPHGPG